MILHRFSIPIVKAIGGQRITDVRLDEILQDIEQISPHPQVHTVLLGSNNFRNLDSDPIQVLKLLEDFVKAARTYENCHVYVCTLVPSIENKENCDSIFLQWDRSLRIILDTENEIIDLQRKFRKKQQITESLYDSDGVHLNHDGADLLAKLIFDRIRRTPYEFFD